MTPFEGRVALIGSGNVATHLAGALAPCLCAVFSRNIEHAQRLADKYGLDAYCDFGRLASLRPDVIVISIADNAISDVVRSIGRLDYEPLVVHTSGTVAKEELSAISPRVGVLYPLQTFSAAADVVLEAVPFFTEAARAADLQVVDALASSVSERVYHADAESRRVLHIAGVFTSNFTNVLLECVERILGGAGYSLDIVRPLLETTVAKLFALGPHQAQTGPARRGDFDVIARQQAALPADLKPVYQVLTNLILQSHGIDNHEQN